MSFTNNFKYPKISENFLGTEQNSSIIRVSEQNLEQNKRFLRALPAGRISHFTSRIYPSLVPTAKRGPDPGNEAERGKPAGQSVGSQLGFGILQEVGE